MKRCPQHIVERKKAFYQQHVESAPIHLKPRTYVFTVRERCLKTFTRMVPGVVSGSRILCDFFLFFFYFLLGLFL